MEKVKGAWVRIEGVFTKGPGGHGGLWPGEIGRVTKFDIDLPASTTPAKQ